MTRTIVLLAGLFAVNCSGSPVAPGEQSRSVPTSPPPPVNFTQVSRTVLVGEAPTNVDLGSSPIDGTWSVSCDGSVRHDITVSVLSSAGTVLGTNTSAHSALSASVQWTGRAGEIYRAVVVQGGTPLEWLTLRVSALVPAR